MPEERDCVVKLVDDHGVEHSVRVRAKSVYEAALRGLTKLEKVGWESDGSQIGSVWLKFGKSSSGDDPCVTSGPTNRRARIYETNLPLKTLLCDCFVPAAAQPPSPLPSVTSKVCRVLRPQAAL
jgi:hypothetical protein